MERQRTRSLKELFADKQQEMVTKGMAHGFSHPDVVKASQELDQIHNALIRLEQNLVHRTCELYGVTKEEVSIQWNGLDVQVTIAPKIPVDRITVKGVIA